MPALVIVVLAGAPATAASNDAIDCGKAEQADEKAICADPALVEDDARMAALYAKAMAVSGMGERGALQDGQAAWLAERQGCKADARCIGSTYTARIDRLRSVIDAATTRDP